MIARLLTMMLFSRYGFFVVKTAEFFCYRDDNTAIIRLDWWCALVKGQDFIGKTTSEIQ